MPRIPEPRSLLHSAALHGGIVIQEVVTWLLRSAWPRKPSEGLTTLPRKPGAGNHREGIEEMEDYYLAADVLERVRKGQEQVHLLTLGLED